MPEPYEVEQWLENYDNDGEEVEPTARSQREMAVSDMYEWMGVEADAKQIAEYINENPDLTTMEYQTIL